MLDHLLELRRRALILSVLFAGLFLLFFVYANPLFQIVISPLLSSLPLSKGIIATQITSPVLIPMKLAADTALLATAPFALAQGWLFVSPALYRQEKAPLACFMVMGFMLFCLGMLFCFFIALPLMFHFFAQALPTGVTWLPDMNEAIAFITRMLLLFGLCFQVPLLCVAVVRLQWIDLGRLQALRPYIIVGAFILGMLLTPPDVPSQIMLALPLCLLYELGLFLAKRIRVRSSAFTTDVIAK